MGQVRHLWEGGRRGADPALEEKGLCGTLGVVPSIAVRLGLGHLRTLGGEWEGGEGGRRGRGREGGWEGEREKEGGTGNNVTNTCMGVHE